MDPAPAVASNLVAELLERPYQRGVALQCHADGKHGQRQLAFFKFPKNAPHTDTGAVFVNAFHADMARGVAWRIEHLGQKLLGAGIAV